MLLPVLVQLQFFELVLKKKKVNYQTPIGPSDPLRHLQRNSIVFSTLTNISG